MVCRIMNEVIRWLRRWEAQGLIAILFRKPQISIEIMGVFPTCPTVKNDICTFLERPNAGHVNWTVVVGYNLAEEMAEELSNSMHDKITS